MGEAAFQQAYKDWLEAHIRMRHGERRERLSKQHSIAKKEFLYRVWWPLFHNFDHLHPEYEVRDFADGFRYLDFAYLRPPFRICIEIDGYGPRLSAIPPSQFADQNILQDYLVSDLWIMIRFSFDDVRDRPKRCREVLLTTLDRFFRVQACAVQLTPYERDMVRLAVRSIRPITPSDACFYLNLCDKTARKLLKGLVEKKLLEPASGGKERVHSYQPALEPQLLLYIAG